jgi:arsenate reductase-like glutaredoxin family protein
MTNNQSELDVLQDVVTRLESRGFDYMLTGSLAMNYYAQPRMTRDIDIVVALTGNDVRQIMATFGTDYYIPEETLVTAIRAATIFNLIHLESVVKVDIIVRKADEYRRHEFDRRMAVEISGFKTWIVSKEDLILSKLHWAKDSRSEMQLRDIKNLLATSPDMEYIRKWAKQLGIDTLLKECLHE